MELLSGSGPAAPLISIEKEDNISESTWKTRQSFISDPPKVNYIVFVVYRNPTSQVQKINLQRFRKQIG